MKKIMEKRFMFVGTLEEAEFNRVVSQMPISLKSRSDVDYSLPDAIGTMGR